MVALADQKLRRSGTGLTEKATIERSFERGVAVGRACPVRVHRPVVAVVWRTGLAVLPECASVPRDNFFVPVAISSGCLVGVPDTNRLRWVGWRPIRRPFPGPLISGSEAIMPRRKGVVKHFVVLFSSHYIFGSRRLISQFQSLWSLTIRVFSRPLGHDFSQRGPLLPARSCHCAPGWTNFGYTRAGCTGFARWYRPRLSIRPSAR